MKNYKYLSIITGLFTASLLISNTLDTKIFLIGPLALPAGIILFPIAYLFGDILTEVYGYAASRKVIWTGFASLALMVLTYTLAGLLKPAPFWQHQNDFDVILGQVPRIALASITAYFLGEFSNSFVLAKMKVRSTGKRMGVRFVTSTIVGEFVDTAVFVLIAFTGAMGLQELVFVTLSAWAFKVAWEIAVLPVTLPFVKWLKRKENEDYFDANTDFNPFKFS